MQIYLFLDEQQNGPYSEEEVLNRVSAGTASMTTLAWHEGMDEWQPLNTIISLSATPPKPLLQEGVINTLTTKQVKTQQRTNPYKKIQIRYLIVLCGCIILYRFLFAQLPVSYGFPAVCGAIIGSTLVFTPIVWGFLYKLIWRTQGWRYDCKVAAAIFGSFAIGDFCSNLILPFIRHIH